MATINSINSNIPIELSKGGTNASSMANANGINYYDGTRIVTTTVGTAGQIMTSNGVGIAPTFQNSPAPSVVSTYSPVVSFGGGSTGITYGTQEGAYYVIGKAVFFSIDIVLTSKGSSTGQSAVTLPPITPAVSNSPTAFPVVQYIIKVFDASNFYSVAGIMNGSTIELFMLGNNVGFQPITHAEFSATSAFQVSGFYFTS